jgi:hypothetical protein
MKLESSDVYEKALADLESKRDALVARVAELPEVRSMAAYDAHVGGNAEAIQTLDQVSAELSSHASDLASIDDAIAAAKKLFQMATSAENYARKRESAKEAVELIAAFKKAGHDMDQALRTIAEMGDKLTTLLGAIHRTTGSSYPTADQVDVLGHSALMTALLRTPWARRFRPLQPSQRRDFGPTFDGWATVLENRIKPLLTEADDEAA